MHAAGREVSINLPVNNDSFDYPRLSAPVDYVKDHRLIEEPIETLYIDEAVEDQQKLAVAELRRTRDGKAVSSALAALRQACAGTGNIMPPLIEAVKTYATVGEISDVMREVFATYEEPAVY